MTSWVISVSRKLQGPAISSFDSSSYSPAATSQVQALLSSQINCHSIYLKILMLFIHILSISLLYLVDHSETFVYFLYILCSFTYHIFIIIP